MFDIIPVQWIWKKLHSWNHDSSTCHKGVLIWWKELMNLELKPPLTVLRLTHLRDKQAHEAPQLPHGMGISLFCKKIFYCKSSNRRALAGKTLLAKQWDAHAMLSCGASCAWLSRKYANRRTVKGGLSSKFMSSFHQINTPLWHVLLSWFLEWSFFQIHWTCIISNTWSFAVASLLAS